MALPKRPDLFEAIALGPMQGRCDSPAFSSGGPSWHKSANAAASHLGRLALEAAQLDLERFVPKASTAAFRGHCVQPMRHVSAARP